MGDHATDQADNEVADAGQHARAVAGADLAAILVEGHIAHPMQTVLDAPMTPIERQQALRRGLGGCEIGDQPGPFERVFTGPARGYLAFDQGHLADMRKAHIGVERGGGADRAAFDPAMAFIDGGVLRGGRPPSRRL